MILCRHPIGTIGWPVSADTSSTCSPWLPRPGLAGVMKHQSLCTLLPIEVSWSIYLFIIWKPYFKSIFNGIFFVWNFKSNTTMTSNTDRSRTVTLIAPTIDISPEKAVPQQCMQNVIKIKSNKTKNCMIVLQIIAGKNCSVQLKLPQALGSTNNADQCPPEMLK